MNAFLAFTLTGLFTGAAYAIAASGLVLTYTTTRVFNLAHGAIEHGDGVHVLAVARRRAAARPRRDRAGPARHRAAVGALLQKFVMKGLGDAPVSVSLVVTLGLFVLLIGIADAVLAGDDRRATSRSSSATRASRSARSGSATTT